MPKQPPRRARATAEASRPSVEDPTTERALSDLHDKVSTDRKAAVTPLVQRLTLIAQRPTPTVNRSLYDSDVDGELYYRDGEGRDIQLTDDGAIAGAGIDVGPLPANISAITVNASGTLDVNDSGNVIQDLYVVNLHTTGTADSHGIRFKQMLPALLGINSGTPINFTNGRGVGSAAGAAKFYCALPEMRRGDRILSVAGTFGTGLGAGTSGIILKRCNGDNLAPATVGSASSGSTGQPITVTISGLTETVASGISYVLEVDTGRAQDSFTCITVEYDRP
jgi:hypothetical protein